MARIAFLGLGRMGSGMAKRMLAAGNEVRVFNRTRERADTLAAVGATVCETAAEACREANAIFAMVADDAASRAVWQGPTGALAGSPAPAAFAVECSTLSHAWVLELATEAEARGLRYLDAPVTGLPDAAAAGKLTLFVGARAEALEEALPLLEPIAERILHFGGVGSGTAYKLLINLVGAVQIASAAEGMALAQKAGLNLGEVADAISLGQAASPQVVRHTRRMAAGDHDQNVVFTPALRLKDVEYALQFARSLGLATPFGDVACELFRELCKRGDAGANESKIFELSRSLTLEQTPRTS
jgi:3-hydroxyisobutyrate dehydrogenase